MQGLGSKLLLRAQPVNFTSSLRCGASCHLDLSLPSIWLSDGSACPASPSHAPAPMTVAICICISGSVHARGWQRRVMRVVNRNCTLHTCDVRGQLGVSVLHN